MFLLSLSLPLIEIPCFILELCGETEPLLDWCSYFQTLVLYCTLDPVPRPCFQASVSDSPLSKAFFLHQITRISKQQCGVYAYTSSTEVYPLIRKVVNHLAPLGVFIPGLLLLCFLLSPCLTAICQRACCPVLCLNSPDLSRNLTSTRPGFCFVTNHFLQRGGLQSGAKQMFSRLRTLQFLTRSVSSLLPYFIEDLL